MSIWQRLIQWAGGAGPVARAVGRNEACHCGSGKKYKRCCLDKDATKGRDLRLGHMVRRELKIGGGTYRSE